MFGLSTCVFGRPASPSLFTLRLPLQHGGLPRMGRARLLAPLNGEADRRAELPSQPKRLVPREVRVDALDAEPRLGQVLEAVFLVPAGSQPGAAGVLNLVERAQPLYRQDVEM